MNIYALYDIALNKSEARWKRGREQASCWRWRSWRGDFSSISTTTDYLSLFVL